MNRPQPPPADRGGLPPAGPARQAETEPGTGTRPSGSHAPSSSAPAGAAPGRKRWLRAGLLGGIGFLLSPLSWWNDLFINIPLALGLAWLVALVWPAAFQAAFIVAYWLTNVLGLVLMTRAAKELLAGRPSPYSRRELLKDLLVAAVYTAVIMALIHFKVLQPIQDYGRQAR